MKIEYVIALIISIVLLCGCTSPPYKLHSETVSIPVVTPTVTAIPAISTTPYQTFTLPVTFTTPTPLPTDIIRAPLYESKYKDYYTIPSGNTGIAKIVSGGWGSGATIYVNSTDYPETKTVFVPVYPDGSSDGIIITSGNYTAALPDKFDNVSEVHNFFVGKDTTTYILFNGYSYRNSIGSGC